VSPPNREVLAALYEASQEIRADARVLRERSENLRAKSSLIALRIAEQRLAYAVRNGEAPSLPDSLISGIHTAATMPADTEPLYGRR
jgi:hypothetical protein